HVFLSNEFNYQELVIKNGYGFSYVYSKKSKYYDIYKQAENFAQLNNLGVWKYCDGKRKAKVAVITAKQKPFTKKKCNAYVKGNISYRTGVKIYHVPGCNNYENTIISIGKGERYFCSEQDAINSGWRKAKNCP
ncbi:TPA: hypothetical protein EYG96_01350, partial [Candidatus Gracilibacteria bacterium]|nr:hypothetical protein [Candidatus Gracilibacteria bacterium]